MIDEILARADEAHARMVRVAFWAGLQIGAAAMVVAGLLIGRW